MNSASYPEQPELPDNRPPYRPKPGENQNRETTDGHAPQHPACLARQISRLKRIARARGLIADLNFPCPSQLEKVASRLACWLKRG